MFLKNPAESKKLLKSALVYFLIGNLLINSGIGGMAFFYNYKNPEKKAKMITKSKTNKTSDSGLKTVTSPNLKPVVATKNTNNFHANSRTQNHSRSATQSGAFSQNDLHILARIIHAEAGGESLRGQVAVGAVLLNRIKSGKFPKTLAANIFRPGEFESVSNGYIWSNPTPSSYRAASLAMKGWDPTYGALYFFNPAKTFSRWIWNRPIIVAIGRHFFAG